MNRMLAAGTLAIGLAVAAPAAAQAPPPNVVVMLTDDQRWDMVGVVQRELGAAGRFPWMRTATPNLDRLAASGTRFKNAFVVSSLCSPSRAAFLTGRYNHANGVRNNATHLPPGSVTYASLLRGAGWRTGYFGKWHMGDQRERPGYDEHASFVNQGVYFNGPFLVNGVSRPTTGWVDDVSTNYVLDFIRRNTGRRFLLTLGFKSAHLPVTPSPREANLFPGASPVPAPNRFAYPPYDPSPKPADLPDERVRDYTRTLAGVDRNVGRVLDTLDKLGLTGRTIVVFTSDNGIHLGEHGVPGTAVPGDQDGDKRAATEESIRIPLLVRAPGHAAGVANGGALNIDLAPTLLALAGRPIPAAMQGKSLAPLLGGGFEQVRDGFLYEYFKEALYNPPTMTALRRGGFKLVDYPGQPGWKQLFDLQADPGERFNLAARPASRPTLDRMTRELAAEKAALGY